jgi:RHS repeat-associated protein
MTDVNGNLVYKGQFDPYGQMLTEWSSSGNTNLNAKKFTGYERDAATGLDYANARMYNSGRGRFMQPDPKGLKAAELKRLKSLNRYAYVENDPVNFNDPEGLFLGNPWCTEIYWNGLLAGNTCGGYWMLLDGPWPLEPIPASPDPEPMKEAKFKFVSVTHDDKEYNFPLRDSLAVDKSVFCKEDSPRFTVVIRITSTNVTDILWDETNISFGRRSAFELEEYKFSPPDGDPVVLPNGDVIRGYDLTLKIRYVSSDFDDGTLSVRLVGRASFGNTPVYTNRVIGEGEVKFTCKDKPQ